ncbi:MAG TPA: hypothetical protein PKD51_11520 [Saprospiraceae bacterium]|nr:hypothetical protein [Saprospiraceae bacterium]HMU05627.1 hypothetical protein [Saprospiraceae bacterium]
MNDLPLYTQGIIIFVSNLLFIYFRTRNVMYNATRDRFGVFHSGIAVHITWLCSTSLGVNAMLHGNYILVVLSLAGGLLGADWAITNKFTKK